MKITLLENSWIIEKQDFSYDVFVHSVEQNWPTEDHQLLHLIVDGVDVFDGYEDYILARKDSIQVIDVVAQTRHEILLEGIQNAIQYNLTVQKGIKGLSDQFYQGPNEETWVTFGELIEGLQWMNRCLEEYQALNPGSQGQGEIHTFRQSFDEMVRNLSDAMERRDDTLIGDILQFEFAPSLVEIENLYRKLLVNEVD